MHWGAEDTGRLRGVARHDRLCPQAWAGPAALRARTTFYLSAPYMLRPVRDTRSFASLAHLHFTNSSVTNPLCSWSALLLIATTSIALRRQ